MLANRSMPGSRKLTGKGNDRGRQAGTAAGPRTFKGRCSCDFPRFHRPAVGIPAERDRRKQPRLLLVAGQMGAGKSTVIASLAREFSGEPQLIIPDELLEFVPGYGTAARVDSIQAQMAAGATPALWNRWLFNRAIANRNDIVFEAARADVATLRRSFCGRRLQRRLSRRSCEASRLWFPVAMLSPFRHLGVHHDRRLCQAFP